jgi:hypothetical protein
MYDIEFGLCFSVESVGLLFVVMRVDHGRGLMLWFEQGVVRWRWLSSSGDVISLAQIC